MAKSGNSIANARILDMDTLTDENFTLDSWLNDEESGQLGRLTKFVEPNELYADVKIDNFLGNLGVNTPEAKAANQVGFASVLGQTTSQGTWSAMKEGWNNNLLQIQIADIRYAEMYNRIDPKEAQRQVDLIKAKMKNTYTKGFASWAKSASNIAPMMIDTTKEGLKYGIVGGGIGGTMAAVAGQAGPQALAPEEVITVPGGMALGFKVGAPIGGAVRSYELESGLMYDELLSMTDENGKKIDPAIAKPISELIGGFNAALELVKIGDLIKTIPGGKKIFARAQRKTVKTLIRSRKLLNVLMRGFGRYGGHVGLETATEVAQEGANIVGDEFAKNLANELQDAKFKPATRKEIAARAKETMLESVKAFTLIAGPGNLMQTMADISTQDPLRAMADDAEKMMNVSPPRKGTPIKSRVDVDNLGKVRIEEPAELPPKKPRKKPPKKETAPTVQEEFQSQQSEATLRASEPFTVKVKLYVGRVTKRMKKQFAKGFGIEDYTQIGDRLDGAFPTKRAPIELTMSEARMLLIHLESSLQDRLDKNQIRTENDLAYANADWGDIRNLRKTLGLPTRKRPFTVVRNPSTQVVEIQNVQKRIKQAQQTRKGKKAIETLGRGEKTITGVQRLNDVMARVQKAAKEAFAAGKKEAKEHFALLQYLREQRKIRDNLIKQIKDKPGDNIDFYYREAVERLQAAIDFGAKTEAQAEEKARLRELIAKNPELEHEIPSHIREMLDKKDIESLSMIDLKTLNNEIQRLRHLGALKSNLYKKYRKALLKQKAGEITENVNKSKKPKTFWSAERALTLRPQRIFDLLDGGRKFLGKAYNFFYQITNDNYTRELENTDSRQDAMRRRREELGIRNRDLAVKRTIAGVTLKLDEWLSVWAGWKNAASRAALRYGGIPQKINGIQQYVPVTDKMITELEQSLSDTEKAWADSIIAEYGEHYDRVRSAIIEAEDRDMGREENYTKVRRVGVEYKKLEEDVVSEIESRGFFRKVGPNKAFSIPRENIPAEYQKPMELGLTRIHLEEIRKQEHYINNAVHIKEMRNVANNKEFRAAVEDKYGAPFLRSIDEFIDRIANPDYYKSYTEIEKLSKALRKNTAMAYIAFNVSSVLNQIPSILNYWAYSSTADMITSTIDLLLHPQKAYEAAVNTHYQLKHQSIEREMEELKRTDVGAYGKIMGKIGRTGMLGIYIMDRATRIIGINAIYNKAIRDGMSPAQATRKSAAVTLRVQEAASPKDLARLYSTNEVLNWFTMFTNQLNQIYNMTTYDIPVAFYNKSYNEATRTSMALGVAAMMIWMIDRGELPDEPEDALVAVGEQALGSVPIIGSAVVSGAKGWKSQAPPPIKSGAQLGAAGYYLYDEEYEKALEQLTEPLAIGTGLPYQSAKEAIKFIEEID